MAVAPVEFDCVFDGIDILSKNAGETHDCRKFGVDGVIYPFIPRLWMPTAQDSTEAHGQASHLAECLGTLLQGIDLSRLAVDPRLFRGVDLLLRR
ncbi:hypothetical protein ABIC60_003557 [Phyllobacterium ifriqiyense]